MSYCRPQRPESAEMEAAGVLCYIGCQCCLTDRLIVSLLALKVEGDKRVQNKTCLHVAATLLGNTLTLAGAELTAQGGKVGKKKWKFKSSGRGYSIGKVRALLIWNHPWAFHFNLEKITIWLISFQGQPKGQWSIDKFPTLTPYVLGFQFCLPLGVLMVEYRQCNRMQVVRQIQYLSGFVDASFVITCIRVREQKTAQKPRHRVIESQNMAADM